MTVWQASIIVAAGGGGGEPRMWSLRMTCGKDYPKAPPTVQFISRISMEGVDARGALASVKVPYLASWNPGKCLHGVLSEIKTLIQRAPRAQPPDGASF
jgi:ubiquitin-conjugating enzyme E2 variant